MYNSTKIILLDTAYMFMRSVRDEIKYMMQKWNIQKEKTIQKRKCTFLILF